ncbi:MBL fold metallo-hydrolase [Jannaschia sp. Os4]|uniref:MBL fold metallo-hydrolase n=1 Tax=Jannaschia sp. Os4 TaxID=2807617 RepID=UPI00193AA5C9|nr:MBL fold metallo-hydrolase [Jannaschia sp. Os4]MBM2578127.1 MBL fold metallo-hydrolase [Jannaschia sp. Os4]
MNEDDECGRSRSSLAQSARTGPIRRRSLIAAGGALTLAALLPQTPWSVGAAAAQDGSGIARIVGAQRFRAGDAIVTALSDGYFPSDPEIVQGASPEELRPLFEAAFLDMDDYVGSVNAYLVDLPGRRLLIDAGGALEGVPSLGRLPDTLRVLGIDPGSIDSLLATHMHPDHVGGALTAGGARAFPNANLVLSEVDLAFWRSAEAREAGAEGYEQNQRVLAVFGPDRIRAFADGASVAEGVTLRALTGHTPGHSGYAIGTGPEGLLVWGDVVHVPAVQFPRTDLGVAFDIDATQAARTRVAIMDEAAAGRLRVAGMHNPFPGVGFVARVAGTGSFAFVPSPYDHRL